MLHDPAHFIDWKSHDWIAPYLPEDVAKHYPREYVDPDGMHAVMCAWLEVIGYNADLVAHDAAPKNYADLSNPKWKGKLVKAHPGYSGAILTTTFLLVRELGWPYLEKLAARRSCRFSPRLIHPRRYRWENAPSWPTATTTACSCSTRGRPVETVYPTEGAPLIISVRRFPRRA